jgi:hypothetical protein
MIPESFRSPIFEGGAMNDAQFELFSGILANLGVGRLLNGALGPAIIQAPLRFDLHQEDVMMDYGGSDMPWPYLLES